MEVVVAKTAGFCFGVKRAVDKVYESIKSGKKIYTLGPIIHNNEVVKDLESKGVITLDENDLHDDIKDGVVIIRSHGVPKHIYEYLNDKKIEYIDMTCPFVKRIHEIVRNEDSDTHIVIFGNASHPEVIGIKGWCASEATVIETASEAQAYEIADNKRVTIVSQTTFNYKKFQEFVEIFAQKRYDVNVVNTICDATCKRQSESAAIAKEVDAMIVIGDKHSSNSKKLYDICSDACDNTYFIQTLDELALKLNDDDVTVGITAGASTPNYIIEEVQNYVRINF